MTAPREPSDRRVARLRTLVEAESPSRDMPALDAALDAVAAMAREDGGRDPARVALAGGVPALLREATRTPRVLLLCHVDTVWPVGSLATVPFAVAGGRATGPGVYDMKAGIVVALEALRLSAAREHLALLVTVDEEVGSAASRGLIERVAAECAAVLVLEGSGPGGAVKDARKGVAIYDIEIEGRAAHAGTEPERGVNATLELAHLALDLAALADAAAGTTVTPTVAASGTTTNTIPAMARLGVDVRAWRASEIARVDAAIRARAPAVAGARVHVHGGPNRLPLEPEHAAWLLALARHAAVELGLGELAAASVGAASDGNITAALGIPTLDGLGAVGGGGHAPGEWVDVVSLGSRAALVARLAELVVEESAGT
jgi:glutamate carboxypeptidase